MPRLYSYVVYHDTGFAPNPYHGYCTLACCKPHIRRTAQVGDWIVGIGSSTRGSRGQVVYAMQVIETLNFEDYWDDPRFKAKRPRMDLGHIESVGDNIYHRNELNGEWIQEPSQHPHSDRGACEQDMDVDLSVDRMLIGETFVYWGGDGPRLPAFAGEDLFAGRGHKFKYRPEVVREFLEWYGELGLQGVVGEPADLKQVVFPVQPQASVT